MTTVEANDVDVTAPSADTPDDIVVDRSSGVGIARRTAGGMLWTAIGNTAQIVLQIAFLAVLARLISPRDFGVVSAALVVVNLSVILAESGLNQAVVQRKDLTTTHVRVALTLSVILGALVWAGIALCAPFIASAFGIPRLTPVIRVISAVFFLRNLTVGDYLLQRHLDFRKLAMVELVSYAFGYGAVAIILAFRGWGVWAVVAGYVAQAALRTVILWIVAPHSMLPSLARRPAVELLRFGGGLTIAQFAGFAATNGDNFVVGRFLGEQALGLYGRAYQLMTMPAMLFGRIANQVLFPAMARVQDNLRKLRRAYSTTLGLLSVLALPVSVVAWVLGPEVIDVVLGERWRGLRPAFNLMVWGMLFRTNYKISDSVALSVGAVYRRGARQLVYAVVVVVGALIGQHWGIEGVSVGVLIALTVNYFLMAQLCLDLIKMKWRQFFAIHGPAVTVAAAMGAAAELAAVGARHAGFRPVAVLAVACLPSLVVGLGVVRMSTLLPLPGFRGIVALANDTSELLGGPMGRVVSRAVGSSYRPTHRRSKGNGC